MGDGKESDVAQAPVLGDLDPGNEPETSQEATEQISVQDLICPIREVLGSVLTGEIQASSLTLRIADVLPQRNKKRVCKLVGAEIRHSKGVIELKTTGGSQITKKPDNQ